MTNNPFKILGVDPRIIRKMDNATTFEVVRGNYRTLLKIYHPDIHPNGSKKTQELNKAFSLLEDHNSPEFVRFKNDHLKVVSNKQVISELEREIGSLQIQISKLADENFSFFFPFLVGLCGFSNPEIFSLRSCLLPMSDYIMSQNRDTITDAHASRRKRRANETADQFYEKETRFELIIDENGEVHHHRWSGRLEHHAKKRLIGVIRRDDFGQYSGIKEILRAMNAGDDVFTARELERVQLQQLTSSSKAYSQYRKVEYFKNQMNPGGLKSVRGIFRPDVPHRGDFVFSLNEGKPGNFYLSLEGFMRDEIMYPKRL